MIVAICVIVFVFGGLGVLEGLGLIGWGLFEGIRQLVTRDPRKPRD